jgi:hypothetical protein
MMEATMNQLALPWHREPKPSPNAAGFVSLADVRLIAHRFNCTVEKPTNEFALTVIGESTSYYRKNSKVIVTAVDAGLWDPIDIIAACRTATGETTLKVFPWRHTENLIGLNELRIARILAAAGTKPYSKSAQHMWDRRLREKVVLPPGSATDIFQTIIHAYKGRPRPSRWHQNQTDRTGMWHTKFFKSLLLLEFLGLIAIQRGPKGGMETCRISWLPLAYLQTCTPVPETLHDDDEHAIACLAEGLPV